MKKLWCCLFIALAFNAAFIFAQSMWLMPYPAPTPMLSPVPSSNWTGMPFAHPWLQINCHNPAKNQKLKPEWTVIVTSVKPTIKQIDINRWEISFH